MSVKQRQSPLDESDKSQGDKCKEVARELEADEDEARWEERLRRVAKQAKPDAEKR